MDLIQYSLHFSLQVLFISAFTLPILFLFTILLPLWANYRANRSLLSKEDFIGSLLIVLCVWLSASFLYGFPGPPASSFDFVNKAHPALLAIFRWFFIIIPSLIAALLAFAFFDGFKTSKKKRVVLSLLLGILVLPQTGVGLGFYYMGIHHLDPLGIVMGTSDFQFRGVSLVEIIIWFYFGITLLTIWLARKYPGIRRIPLILGSLFVMLILLILYTPHSIGSTPNWLGRTIISSTAFTNSPVKIEKFTLVHSMNFSLSPDNNWFAEPAIENNTSSIVFHSQSGQKIVLPYARLRKVFEVAASADFAEQDKCFEVNAPNNYICRTLPTVSFDEVYGLIAESFSLNDTRWGVGWSHDSKYFYIYDSDIGTYQNQRYLDQTKKIFVGNDSLAPVNPTNSDVRFGLEIGPIIAGQELEIVQKFDIHFDQITCGVCETQKAYADFLFHFPTSTIGEQIRNILNLNSSSSYWVTRLGYTNKDTLGNAVILQNNNNKTLYFGVPEQQSKIALYRADLNNEQLTNIKRIQEYKEQCGNANIDFTPSPDNTKTIVKVTINGDWCNLNPRTYFLMPQGDGESIIELNPIQCYGQDRYDAQWDISSKYFYYLGQYQDAIRNGSCDNVEVFRATAKSN